MRPALLNPLFAPVTSLPGVGPKQDKLLCYLLGRDETPRLVDLLLHLPASVIDRRARPKNPAVVQGNMRSARAAPGILQPSPPTHTLRTRPYLSASPNRIIAGALVQPQAPF